MQTTMDEQQLKRLLKAVFAEVLEEHRGLLHDVLEETLEDISFARAIEQGEDSALASREEVFAALQSAA